MTLQLDITKPEASLKAIIDAVRNGDDVVLHEGDKQLARVTAATMPVVDRRRLFGMLKGQIWMADDFNELSEEELDLWCRDDPLLQAPET